jgi:8-oxo-dGTP diphosphatase
MNVVAALIERDGMVLICQRKAGQRHAGKWEFPGGKVEPEEGLRAALERELFEELGIKAKAGDEAARYHFSYPERSPIQLVFYRVVEFEGEPVNRIFEQIRWESMANLPGYDFLEGDVEFVKKLSAPAEDGNRRSARD